MKRSLLMMLMVLVPASRAWTQEATVTPASKGFYTVKEQGTPDRVPETTLDPVKTAEEIFEQASETWDELKVTVYSLIDFDFHNEKFGDVSEPYNRMKHFGTWVRDSRDATCYDTRTKVLIRDSSVPVGFRRNKCTVQSGRWVDPYGGREYTDSTSMQIDHFVPLKNAYLSGASKWNSAKRCLYANFLGNPFHLLAVYGPENNSKGDKTPEGYMPDNRSYQCQYLSQWLKVKFIWSLALTPSEKDKVLALIRDNHCTTTELSFSATELTEQRRFIADNMTLCQ